MFKILIAATLLIGSLTLLSSLWPTRRSAAARRSARTEDSLGPTVRKTDDQWQAQLTREQYRVARRGGTERPFTGAYWNHKAEGMYQCVGCSQDLFPSHTKFDSGTGWPSYWRPDSPEAITEIKDISFGLVRTEVVCSRCESHLGHVFRDGPRPTGLRYCINSASLNFRPAADRLLEHVD